MDTIGWDGRLGPVRAWVLASALILLPASASRGQAPDWERVAIPDGDIFQDPAWDRADPNAPPLSPALAADRSGRLYFANGPRLHVGDGNRWMTPMNQPKAYWSRPQRPLAAGARGTVLWGEWRSRDGGAGWDSLPLSTGISFAHAVLDDGSCLSGGGYDAIYRSEACSDSWTRVHMGRTYGHIRQFAVAGPAVFALPSYAALLQGSGTGASWSDWNPGGKPLLGTGIRAMRFRIPSLGTSLLLALHKTGGRPNALVSLDVLSPGTSPDTLEGALPDSAITSLWIGEGGDIWVGTRGQGIHVSRDQGRTFTAVNGGLGSLHVEALESTSDGVLHALTRGGLYRARFGTTGLRPLPPAFSPRARGHVRLHLPGLPAALRDAPRHARLSVLADGRMIILPAETLSTR